MNYNPEFDEEDYRTPYHVAQELSLDVIQNTVPLNINKTDLNESLYTLNEGRFFEEGEISVETVYFIHRLIQYLQNRKLNDRFKI